MVELRAALFLLASSLSFFISIGTGTVASYRNSLLKSEKNWYELNSVSLGVLMVATGGCLLFVGIIEFEMIVSLLEAVFGNTLIGYGMGILLFRFLESLNDPEIFKPFQSVPPMETSIITDFRNFFRLIKDFFAN